MCQPLGHHPPVLPRAPQGPFPITNKHHIPAFGKGFHAAPGSTGTDISEVDPRVDQKPRQQYQWTYKIGTRGHHSPGLPIYPQGPFTVPYERLSDAKARDSTLHLDQQVQLLLKWITRPIKAPSHRINPLTSVYLADTTLQACQQLLKTLSCPPRNHGT